MTENLHVCHWCGRDSTEQLQSCVHCGTTKIPYEEFEDEIINFKGTGIIHLRLIGSNEEHAYRSVVAVIASACDKIRRESPFDLDMVIPEVEKILYDEGKISFEATGGAYEKLCASIANQVKNVVAVEYEALPKWL